MATLTVQTVVEAGIAPSYAAAATADEFVNPSDQSVFVHYKNTNAAARTITVLKQKASVAVPDYGALALSDLAVNLPANTGDVMLGPFPAGKYNDGNGKVQLTLSANAGVTVAVIRVARAAG